MVKNEPCDVPLWDNAWLFIVPIDNTLMNAIMLLLLPNQTHPKPKIKISK